MESLSFIRKTALAAVAVLCFATTTASAQTSPTNAPTPPPLAREFRGVWVATVFNIDWPSTRTNSALQKAELIDIMDKAVALNCNAVILQIRPTCEAFYQSQLEPWSEYLTGTLGKAPEPFYDPLTFATTAAHNRGLELHAWINPYRARSASAKTPAPPNHITQKRPDLIRPWGKWLWLDPTEPATRDHSLAVVRDVVRRYDIDAIHFDDYFYPYPEGNAGGFPDDNAWNRYVAAGGKLARDDWRREQVDNFVRTVHATIKAEKPWVKFGISPFGIWKTGVPESIKGLSAVDILYADARKWLQQGWVDYLAPQLYWPIDAKEQSFPVLLDWWVQQNTKQRHIWPGMNLEQKNVEDASEAMAEIAATRKQAGASGHILWHAKSIMNNSKGVTTALTKAYAQPALVPACPWLNTTPPATPSVSLEKKASALNVDLIPGGRSVWLWAIQTKQGDSWSTEILPGHKRSVSIKPEAGKLPQAVAVTAINRYGNPSLPVVRIVK